KYQKSWSQVVLRYQIERGVVVIPKSHSAEHQAANLAIFDFSLTDEEKEIIKGL
ncbi:MAG TPA: aldo/keto reductase, partial [Enterococcus sp.]|nr:aldo/keto reductase [Enterococcus sp.]